MSRHLTKNREWFFQNDELMNILADILIEDSGKSFQKWGWRGKLIISKDVACPGPSREEKDGPFTRGEHWTCLQGVKFRIIYVEEFDDDELMMASPYGCVHSLVVLEV